MAAGTITLLLPPRTRFGGQRLGPSASRWIPRGDRRHPPGSLPERLFRVEGAGWPVAAATRQRDAGDAGSHVWLRADPVHVRPDINGVRLLSHGDALLLEPPEVEEFLGALRPLFAEGGMEIDAPVPTRWYVRLPAGTTLPPMASVEDALGEDLFDNLPAGPEGRRWRALLTEAQVVLHNHPHNTARAAAGLAPVNSLWFWGGGPLPAGVSADFRRVLSDDDGLRAMATLADSETGPLPPAWPGVGDGLADLRHARDLAVLERDWFAPVFSALETGAAGRVRLAFADGLELVLLRRHALRLWRRPLQSFITDLSGEAAVAE